MTIMTSWLDAMEDYGFADFEESTLVRLLADAHDELCLREPWPFRERQTTVVQAANDATVYITGMLNNSSVGQILAIVNTTDRNVLVPMRNDTQLKDFVYDLTTTGVPTHYYFIGDTLTLWPIPDGEKTLEVRYLIRPYFGAGIVDRTTPDSDILWPALHNSVVLYSALSKAYLMNDDPQSAVMQQVMEQRLQVARNDLWMKQYDRPDRVIVLDDNDYNF